ncbi:putative Cytochrome c domain-containing protein [Seiridium cardinale]|uniref:Cytochrome c domain-containing protein n=1 Tax=Seiridium cardinale TaxID=138064 RepID=A0ABR2XE79_9PEZI
MEVVGVVLGALPLAIEAIKNYQECSQTLKAYWRYKDTLQGIRDKLFIQQRILETTWEDFTGLEHPTIEQIQKKLRRLEPQNYDGFMAIIHRLNRLQREVLEKLDIDDDGKPQWNKDYPERAKWEWKRVKNSFGRRETKELFDDINQWNHALRLCLSPRREIPSDKSDPLTAGRSQQFDATLCNEIRRNADILHDALASSWCSSHTDVHVSGISIGWHQGGLDSEQDMQLSLPDVADASFEEARWHEICAKFLPRNRNTGQVPTPQTHVQASLPTGPENGPKSPSPSSRKSLFGRKKVTFGETQYIRPPTGQLLVSQPPVTSPIADESTLKHITSLCSLRASKSWNGYLDHPDPDIAMRVQLEKAGGTYDCALGSASLKSLVSSSSKLFHSASSGSDFRTSMTRRDRYSIAAATVWAVLLLCGTSWLEQTWLNKDDLLVLMVEEKPTGQSGKRTEKRPTLKHNFSTLKIDPPSDDFHTTYVKHETLFSLGILLIELGLNRSFEKIRANYHEALQTPDTSSVMDDSKIADLTLGAVRNEVGDSYGDAIERCLGCHFLCPGGTRDFKYAEFRSLFYNGVVAPVQATYDSLPRDILSLQTP